MERFRGGKNIYVGHEDLDKVFENSKKVFLVCDPFLEENGSVSYITDILKLQGKEYAVCCEITPDPTVETVISGVQVVNEFSPDTMVGFGGGSAIDACKAMLFFAKKTGGVGDVLFIAIPTTSGTGSEVTDFSVITDEKKQIKYPIKDEGLMPDIAVLDAELTLSVPQAVTAATGMDALTHALEALVCTRANDFSDAAAEKAVKLIRSNLLTAYREPDNLKARQAMHNASCLAGIAFNNSGLGLNHGMAHAVGAKFKIPHGIANAILLPYVIGYNAGCFDELTETAASYARIAGLIDVNSHSIRQSAFNLIRNIKKLNDALSIPSGFMNIGIDKLRFKSELTNMAEAAFDDGCTATNPRAVSVDDIVKIYTQAYFGSVARNFDIFT